MKRAIDYAHLVGKYVRMERPPVEVEWLEERSSRGGDVPADWTVGAEGTVSAVWDSNTRVGGPAVEVMMDYGMGFAIFPEDQDDWTFRIADTRETMKATGR